MVLIGFSLFFLVFSNKVSLVSGVVLRIFENTKITLVITLKFSRKFKRNTVIYFRNAVIYFRNAVK